MLNVLARALMERRVNMNEEEYHDDDTEWGDAEW